MSSSTSGLRVLHILPSLQQSYGGPIRAVLDLSARAEVTGLHSEILGFGELAIPDNPLRLNCIHTIPIAAPTKYCYAPGLRRWLRENLGRFDCVVLHGMWMYPNFAVSQECIRAGLPYACFPHGMLEPWSVYHQGPWKAAKKVLYWYLRERHIFRRARCVYFTAERERQLAEKAFHLGGVQRLLIPYGADMTSIPTMRPANPAIIQPPGRRVALFLGRLHPKKNIHFLLDAWHQASPPHPWHLVIAGSGDERYTDQLRHSIACYGLTDKVHLVGFVSGQDKSYLLRAASWFLLSSLQENFGIAVIEALSYGCPVVISDQVFLADTLHSRSEILPLDMKAWVKFIQERMMDDHWRSTLVALDQAHLAESMGIEKVAKDWAATLVESFA